MGLSGSDAIDPSGIPQARGPRSVGGRSPLRLVAISIVLVALAFAPVVEAQYGVPSGSEELGRGRRTAKKSELEEWVRRLEDPRPSVRFAAVKWLGESGDPKVVRHLVAASRDPDSRIAVRAVDYLGRLRATEASDALVEQLFIKGTSDPLRQQILVALGRIGDSRASRSILDFAKQAATPELRAAAIYALGETGDGTFRDEIARLIERETDPKVKKVGEDALERISGRRFEPTPRAPGSENPLLRSVEP